MRLTKKILKQWATMTDYNAHSEVVLSIAVFFGFTELAKEFNEILLVHFERGHILLSEVTRRSELSRQMLDLIEAKHGKRTRDRVNECF